MKEEDWPKTVQEAVDRVIDLMPEKEERRIKSLIKEHGVNGAVNRLHLNLGMWIRNEFGLWAGNDALRRSIRKDTPEITRHPDAYSWVLLEKICERLSENE